MLEVYQHIVEVFRFGFLSRSEQWCHLISWEVPVDCYVNRNWKGYCYDDGCNVSRMERRENSKFPSKQSTVGGSFAWKVFRFTWHWPPFSELVLCEYYLDLFGEYGNSSLHVLYTKKSKRQFVMYCTGIGGWNVSDMSIVNIRKPQ